MMAEPQAQARKIKGIFFDAADVFYRRPKQTDDYVADLLAEGGYPTGPVDGDGAGERDLRGQAMRGKMSPPEYWDRFLLLRGVSAPEERRSLVRKIIDYSDTVVPIAGGSEAVAGLKQRGFTLGIVTDTIYPLERKMGWLASVGVAPHIDVVACSTSLGIQKPDPAIYLNAVHQANLTSAEAAFVGHDARELAGARAAGLATVAVNHDASAEADYYASSLLDLLNVPLFATAPVSDRVKQLAAAIEVIFIDIGDTLRVLVEDEPYQARARQQIASLAGASEDPAAFCARLDERYKVYRKWAFETLREASERELWTRWLLPDLPAERIGPVAGDLTFLYRQTMGRRFARPGARDVVVELTRRGYRLGILSNTITEREIPNWLEEDGLSQFFPTVVLSSVFGHRKPGPEIYWEAARVAGVEPGRAAYVGDKPSRDVVGARRAGLGMSIIMIDPESPKKKDLTGENEPDLVIAAFRDLLDVFPPRGAA